LASVINAPSLFDPFYAEGNQARAEERFAYVIDGMVSEGWLDPAEAERTTFPEILEPQPTSASQGVEGYIANEVRRELVQRHDVPEQAIDLGGLRITTTIEKKHQDAAVAAVAEGVPTGENTEDLQVGLVAVRPGDGAITAMYGGEDYSQRQLNNATDARLQAGSLFKVYALLAAVDDGISTLTRFPGPSPMYFTVEGESEPYEVNNFRNEQFGEIDLRTATAFSVNTVYVQLNELVGPERTRQMAVTAGLPENTPGLTDDLSNVLGPAAPTVKEMANSYATVAAQGERATPYLVRSLTSVNGAYEFDVEPDTEQVINPDVTADVVD